MTKAQLVEIVSATAPHALTATLEGEKFKCYMAGFGAGKAAVLEVLELAGAFTGVAERLNERIQKQAQAIVDDVEGDTDESEFSAEEWRGAAVRLARVCLAALVKP